MNDPENQSKAISDSEDSESVSQNDRIVLILCGLIASGKSTFSKALETHFPQFRRCCQDDLGSRLRVEEVAREYLSLGYSICVDRTNVDAVQRSHWIKIAREFPGTLVWVIVFDTPYEVCVERLRQRVSHPTIKSAEQGLPILARFANAFHHPAPHEGYDCILYLQPPSRWNSQEGSAQGLDFLESGPQQASYTKAGLSSILRRVQSSPATLTPRNPFPSIFAASSASAIGPQRRKQPETAGHYGIFQYTPYPRLSSPIPAQHPGAGWDRGNPREMAVGWGLHPRRSLGPGVGPHHLRPRSGGIAQTPVGTAPATAIHVLPQGVGVDTSGSPSQSRSHDRTFGRGSGRINTGRDGGEPGEEKSLGDSATV